MPEPTCEVLWEQAWRLLSEASSQPQSPFSTPVVATVSAEQHPFTRTVVLRKALARSGELWCYTDRRSAKATHLATGSPYLSWTFWDATEKLQVNSSGPTDWLPTKTALAVFAGLPRHSRKAYATLAAPGTPQQSFTDGLPDDWPDRSVEQTAYAAEYFGILRTKITRMEVLQLRREGHRRLLATREEDNKWQFSWVVP